VSAACAVHSIAYLRGVDDRRFARFAAFFELLLLAIFVLAAARSYQALTDWHQRHPSVE